MNNHVSDLLDKSLFFLGAGATQEAGCKTSSEMLADLENKFTDGPRREAIDFLMACLSYHSVWKSKKQNSLNYTPNIEELVLLLRRIVSRDNYLPYPITGSWSDKINILEAKENNLFENLLKEIEQMLTSWLKIDENSSLKYLDPLTEFFKSFPNEKLIFDIFTLNYDLVLERYFNNLSVTLLNYGFSNGKWVGFDERSQGGKNERIFYYKLHGSLNWCRLEDGSIKERNYLKSDYEGNIKDLMIFGSGNKFLSIDPFLTLIYEFRKKLKEKKYIFVIGYSFFDPYINNLFFESLSQASEEKKIIIINHRILDNYEKLEDKFIQIGEEEFEITENDIKRLIEKLKEIQQSNFLSDLPDFNIFSMPPSLIEMIPLRTGPFLKKYFDNKGEKFLQLIERFVNEEKQQKEIFK